MAIFAGQCWYPRMVESNSVCMLVSLSEQNGRL